MWLLTALILIVALQKTGNSYLAGIAAMIPIKTFIALYTAPDSSAFQSTLKGCILAQTLLLTFLILLNLWHDMEGVY